MSGRVVFALTEAQAAALVLFSVRGGYQRISPNNVPGDLRARSRVFAALVNRGYIEQAPSAATGWTLTPAGQEAAAVARRLASAAGTFPAGVHRTEPCAS